jgi:hypothetical protein
VAGSQQSAEDRYKHNVQYLKTHGTSKRAAALLARLQAKQ